MNPDNHGACTINNYSDPNYASKLKAVAAGVKLLKGKGYALPDRITFHLSSDSENPKAAMGEGIARQVLVPVISQALTSLPLSLRSTNDSNCASPKPAPWSALAT